MAKALFVAVSALAFCCCSVIHDDHVAMADIWTSPDSPISIKSDMLWRGAGKAHVLSGAFDEESENTTRSALVVDSSMSWQAFSQNSFHKALGEVKELTEMSAGDGSPPNAFGLTHDDRGFLSHVQNDSHLYDILARTFGVDAHGCKYGRSSGRDPFIIVQNATMPPDGFHDDICEDYPYHRGITITTYPHERWQSHWGGHFELGTLSQKTLVRVAPMPNRTIIFDGCINHRATNPHVAALPLHRNATISNYFHKTLGVGSHLHSWHWKPHYGFEGWRFAVVMQLRCPLLASVGSPRAPEVVKLPRGLGAGNLFQLRALREKILESDEAGDLLHNRTFGVGEAAGHETVFLHKHFEDYIPNLRSRLLGLVKRADLSAGWNMTNTANLSVRCIEFVRYRGSSGVQTSNIGWHSDGATLVTMVVMVSERSEYEGGSIQLRSDAGDVGYDLSAGDLIAWRGWTQHRVTPVLHGVRDVFVVEWWTGEDCTASLESRGPDTYDGVLYALQFDPTSPALHRYLGEQSCGSLPCQDEEIESLAETAYRHAVLLAPNDASSLHSLGNFLVGSARARVRKEGINYLHEAHRLDPSVVGPVADELQQESEWESMVGQMWKVGALVVAIIILLIVIQGLERMQSCQVIVADAHQKKQSSKKED